MGATEIFTLCEMCVWRCGVTAKVKDGRIVKLDGNPNHPHSRGMLCPRGQAGLGLTYDPDGIEFLLPTCFDQRVIEALGLSRAMMADHLKERPLVASAADALQGRQIPATGVLECRLS